MHNLFLNILKLALKRVYIVLFVLCAFLGCSSITAEDNIDLINLPAGYDYNAVLATWGDEVITIEEFNYFLRKILKDKKLQPENNGYDVSLNNKIDSIVVKKTKEKALSLAIEYEVLFFIAKENNFKTDIDVKSIINNEIFMSKRTGYLPKEKKLQFYKYQHGMSSEKAYEDLRTKEDIAFSFSKQYKDNIKPTHEELRTFYSMNAEKFKGIYTKKYRILKLKKINENNEKISEETINKKISEIEQLIDEIKIPHKNDLNISNNEYLELLKQHNNKFIELIKKYSYVENSNENIGLTEIKKWEAKNSIFDEVWDSRMYKGQIYNKYLEDENAVYFVKFEDYGNEETPRLENISKEVLQEYINFSFKNILKTWTEEKELKINYSIFNKIHLPKKLYY